MWCLGRARRSPAPLARPDPPLVRRRCGRLRGCARRVASGAVGAAQRRGAAGVLRVADARSKRDGVQLARLRSGMVGRLKR